MKRGRIQKVIVSLPFDGYDDWDAEIERSIEREIERLEDEEGDDGDFLAALKRGDVDYDAIYDQAAAEYVAQFDEVASEELGINLSLRFERWNEGGIVRLDAGRCSQAAARHLGQDPARSRSVDMERTVLRPAVRRRGHD